MLCYKNEAQGATTAAPEAPSAVPEAAAAGAAGAAGAATEGFASAKLDIWKISWPLLYTYAIICWYMLLLYIINYYFHTIITILFGRKDVLK